MRVRVYVRVREYVRVYVRVYARVVSNRYVLQAQRASEGAKARTEHAEKIRDHGKQRATSDTVHAHVCAHTQHTHARAHTSTHITITPLSAAIYFHLLIV